MAVASFSPQDAINDFAEVYGTTTVARRLELFLAVYRELLAEAQVEQVGQPGQTLSVTDGTREVEVGYAPRMVNVREAYYVTSATARKRLKPISTDWLDINFAGWREDTSTGEPDYYYTAFPNSSGVTVEGKIVIGLHPIPDETTSGSYPKVHLYGTEYEDLAATDKVPAIFPNVRVFSSGMKWLYARNRDRKRAAEYEADYIKDKHETLAYINSLQEDGDAFAFDRQWMRGTAVE